MATALDAADRARGRVAAYRARVDRARRRAVAAVHVSRAARDRIYAAVRRCERDDADDDRAIRMDSLLAVVRAAADACERSMRVAVNAAGRMDARVCERAADACEWEAGRARDGAAAASRLAR